MLVRNERKLWLKELLKIADPVLLNLSANKLRIKMPYSFDIDPLGKRKIFMNLEAFGRVFNGIAPWLTLELNNEDQEFQVQEKYKRLVLSSFENILNPMAKDYVDFGSGAQCLVDAAYLCQGILRYKDIWEEFSKETQKQLIFELKKTRKYEVPENNWLLFSSMVEVTLLKLTTKCNLKRLNKGVKKFMNTFYLGDAIYSDGKDFTFNYYNSFVIHPMLTDVLQVADAYDLKIKKYYAVQVSRQKRYAEILERLISPEGTFPVLGRTITCRLGAFHSLAHSVLQNKISLKLSYGQIRSAMMALLARQFHSNVSNYDKDGWLKIGFMGAQLSIAEEYINTGSSYHICSFFLPLGLPNMHPFWQENHQKWSSFRIWDGDEGNLDEVLKEKEKINFSWWYKKVKNKLKKILK